MVWAATIWIWLTSSGFGIVLVGAVLVGAVLLEIVILIAAFSTKKKHLTLQLVDISKLGLNNFLSTVCLKTMLPAYGKR